MKNIVSDPKILIIINALHQIITIFFGPFLAFYLISLSGGYESLSIFYIINYIFLPITWFILGSIFRDKFKIGQMRVGVILYFIFILLIIYLGDGITKYIWLASMFYGLSRGLYYFPQNMLAGEKVSNKERTKYEVNNYLVISLLSIVIPILLGSIITLSDYKMTAFIILIISAIQIMLTFLLNNSSGHDKDFDIINAIKKLKKETHIKRIMLVQFLIGFVAKQGVLETIVTILIIIAFKTNFYLGLIISVATLLSVVLSYLYQNLFKKKNDKILIIISSIIPFISLILMIIFDNNITTIIYVMCYTMFVNLINIIQNVRLLNISNTKMINKQLITEYFVLKEFICNLGRVIGFSMLLFVAVQGIEYLNYLLIFLTFIVIIIGCILIKIEKYEE